MYACMYMYVATVVDSRFESGSCEIERSDQSRGFGGKDWVFGDWRTPGSTRWAEADKRGSFGEAEGVRTVHGRAEDVVGREAVENSGYYEGKVRRALLRGKGKKGLVEGEREEGPC